MYSAGHTTPLRSECDYELVIVKIELGVTIDVPLLPAATAGNPMGFITVMLALLQKVLREYVKLPDCGFPPVVTV